MFGQMVNMVPQILETKEHSATGAIMKMMQASKCHKQMLIVKIHLLDAIYLQKLLFQALHPLNRLLITLELNKCMQTSNLSIQFFMNQSVLCGIAQLSLKPGQTILGQTSVQTQQLVEQQSMKRQVKSRLTLQLSNTQNSLPPAGMHTLVQVVRQL